MRAGILLRFGGRSFDAPERQQQRTNPKNCPQRRSIAFCTMCHDAPVREMPRFESRVSHLGCRRKRIYWMAYIPRITWNWMAMKDVTASGIEREGQRRPTAISA